MDSPESPSPLSMQRPLQGIKVLDLTHALAGPYASMVLGDLGAEVIKVEPTPGGDFVRQWGTKVGGESTFYLATSRNKRSILLDYRAPGALDVVREMATHADVFLENFRPGTIEQMGLSYEALSALNPRLVYGSVSGFGSKGPRAMEPGFDMLAQALSGVMSINGTPDGEPMRIGLPLGDMGAGVWLAMGIVAALHQRHVTGRGQRVESNLLGTMVHMLCHHAQGYLTAGELPVRTGNTHPGIVPYGAYQAQDALMVIAPGSPSMWGACCQVLGLEHLIEHPDFATPQARRANTAQVRVLIEEKLAQDTAARWSARLVAVGVPAAPINNVAQALEDEHVQAAGMIESIAHPTLGTWRAPALPVQFSGTAEPGSTRLPPPLAGEHSVEALRDLGIAEDVIERLLASGVLVQATAPSA